MSDLNFEGMPNKLLNYATMDDIAIVELASDASGSPLNEEIIALGTHILEG